VWSSGVTLSVTLIWEHIFVNGHLIRLDGTTDQDFKPADVEQALHAGEILWLDLHDSSEETLALLRDVFAIHPLAVEDAAEFGQRPKIEEFEHFVSVVFFGADSVGKPMIEVHSFVSENFLITLHKQPCAAFEGMRTVFARHHTGLAARIIVLHHILDSLSDSVFPMLAAFDDQIDAIQEQIMIKPDREQLESLVAFKRWLTDVRKVVAPQRDMINAMLSERVDVPGMTKETQPYFRDLYDAQVKINDLVDSHRDLVSSSMDAYWSMMSNKQNDVMKQLTIMATIFLPLSYLTGFFGQNFGWLVSAIGSWEAFFGIGLGTEALAVFILLWTFKRRGWF
jgi:magnesium transporter